MRVLLIDVNCKSSSTGQIVYNLYSYLNSHGDEAAVCYGRGKKIAGENIYKFGLDVETYLHALLTRITGYTGCFSYLSTLRLIKYIKGFRPDVVHIHEMHAYFVNIVQLLDFLKRENIPVVHTLHCTFSYTGKCGHHLDCDKWKTCCEECPRLKEYVSSVFFDRTKQMFLRKKNAFEGFNTMMIVTPSKWLADFAADSFLGQYPIKVINNGIDINVFHPKDSSSLRKTLNLDDRKKVVLSVAPNIMGNAKGGKWILKIADVLKQENIHFILIGADCMNANEHYDKNVTVLNRISDQNELAYFYSLADMFVICSEMENFPTTCIEAQCCGTPICGFDVGGTKETNLNGDENPFFQYGDYKSLSQYISKHIDDKSNGYYKNDALCTFSSEKFAKEHHKLYHSLQINLRGK